MDALTWIGAIGGLIGALAGVGALILSRNANKIAKAGNAIAEGSAESAGKAVVSADEANRLAQEANDHATDANAIAKRALAVSQDQLTYNWVLEIDDDGATAIRNDSAHEAANVTAIIDSGGEIHAQGTTEQVAALSQLDFDLATLLQKHFDKVDRKSIPRAASSGRGVFIAGSHGDLVETTVRATVTWATTEGVPRSDVIENVLRHKKQIGGHVIRVSEP